MWIPRWIKRVLQAVREESNDIQKTLEKQDAAIHEQAVAHEQKQREAGIIIAEAIKSAASTVPVYEKTQRYKEYRLQKRIFCTTLVAGIFTGVAAIGAIVYAIEAKYQLFEMVYQTDIQDIHARNDRRDAAKQLWASNEALQIDQRAWVGIKALVVTGTKANSGIEVNAVNFGKSPGLHVMVVSGMYNHPGDYTPTAGDAQWMQMIIQERISNFFKPIPIAKIGSVHSIKNLVIEMQPPPAPIDILQMPNKDLEPPGPNRERQMDITLPNSYSLGVLPPDTPYPLEMPQNWSINGATVIMYGEITYSDIFGGASRITRFCAYRPDWRMPAVFPALFITT
jgi:hypothetical protein